MPRGRRLRPTACYRVVQSIRGRLTRRWLARSWRCSDWCTSGIAARVRRESAEPGSSDASDWRMQRRRGAISQREYRSSQAIVRTAAAYGASGWCRATTNRRRQGAQDRVAVIVITWQAPTHRRRARDAQGRSLADRPRVADGTRLCTSLASRRRCGDRHEDRGSARNLDACDAVDTCRCSATWLTQVETAKPLPLRLAGPKLVDTRRGCLDAEGVDSTGGGAGRSRWPGCTRR